MRTALTDIPRAILILLTQVLVLAQLDLLNGYMLSYLYILVLLQLPFETPPWAQLVFGLAVGLFIDVFSFTLGLHTSACLTLAFARPFLIKSMAPRDGYEFGMRPTLNDMGFQWYFIYVGALTLLHHFWLFLFEVWRFDLFPSVLLRTLLSALATILLIFLVQLLFYRTKHK